MGQVVCDISVSVDGYAAGPNQTLNRPFGDGPVEDLHAWMFSTPEENQAELATMRDAGAFVMGRNMFSAGRGDWDLDWTGWWGDEPPFHGPVFVLTHHPREPLAMQGGTTFTFVRRHRLGPRTGEGCRRRPERGHCRWGPHRQPVSGRGPAR